VQQRYDPALRRLYVSEILPPHARNFQIAHQIGLLSLSAEFERIQKRSRLTTRDSEALCRVALANAFAGALLMPYEPFLEAARSFRYDIELLERRFGASFEQVCHRLTTMRRPGQEGVPFHFIRVDIAGNISKRFSASGIRFARFSGLSESRSLTRRGCEVLIALTAAAALCHDDSLSVHGQIGDELTVFHVAHDRAQRKFDEDVAAVHSRAVRAHAMLTAPRLPLTLKLKVIERIQALRRDDVHRPACTAVAAGGPTFRNEFLATESNASVPTVSGFDADSRLVDEVHSLVRLIVGLEKSKKAAEWRLCFRGLRPEARGLFGGFDRDVSPALALVMELDDAADLCVKCVVTADADVHARIEPGAALADDDRPAADELSGEALDTEHFGLRITPVPR